MFDPGPVRLHGEVACGADIDELLDLRPPLGETSKLVAERRSTEG